MHTCTVVITTTDGSAAGVRKPEVWLPVCLGDQLAVKHGFELLASAAAVKWPTAKSFAEQRQLLRGVFIEEK